MNTSHTSQELYDENYNTPDYKEAERVIDAAMEKEAFRRTQDPNAKYLSEKEL